jgi:SAM-dependent methyltransferase
MGTRGFSDWTSLLITARLAKADTFRWLDLCCGSGKALADAVRALDAPGLAVTGVDLAGHFSPDVPTQVDLQTASITTWAPTLSFDLITCVHGLHYVGNKLGALSKAVSWLTADGLFVANFDPAGVRLPGGSPAGRRLSAAMRTAGFDYDGRNRRIRREGHATVEFSYRYLGADEQAGPNYTGQPAVHSYYEIS